MKKVVLVFPPVWSVHSPYVALPLLASVLRTHGHVAEVWDLCMEFYEHILSPSVITEMLSRVEKHDLSDRNLTAHDRSVLGLALVTGSQIVEHVDQALRSFRTREVLLDHRAIEWAMGIVSRALNIISAAYPGLSLSLERMEMRPYSRTSTHGVLQASSDALRNPLIEWYQTVLSPRVLKDAANVSLVGLSVTSSEQVVPAITLSRLIRRDVGPEVPIVLGGNYISRLAPRWDRPHPFLDLVDAIVVGEGEHTLLSLLSLDDWQDAPEVDVPNLIYVRQGRLIKQPEHHIDLDTLPTPDFTGLPLDKYFAPDRVFPVFTSRGCRHKCAFCGIPAASGPFRRRDTDLVISDIRTLQDKFRASYFTFVDETLEPEVLSELANKLIHADLNVRWYGDARLDARLDDALIGKMAQSGGRILHLGLESYSPRVLELMRKGTKAEEIKPILMLLLRHGIAFHLFTIVGFPGETEEEARITLAFLEEMMELAERRYGNRYCSNAVSLFHLDRDSLVARDPHRFGVTMLEPRLEEDLVGECDYQVASGLSKSEAQQVLEMHVGQDCVREAWEKAERLPTSRVLPTRARWEDWTFLRCCYQELGIKRKNGVPRLTKRGESQLGPWCSIRLFPLDPLSVHRTDPVALLYEGRKHRVLSLPSAAITILALLWLDISPAQILRAAELGHLEGLEPPAVRSCLLRLSRNGLVRDVEPLTQKTPLTQESVPIREPSVSLLSVCHDHFVLVDVDAEKVIQTSPEAALVWSLIDGQRSMRDIGASLAERGLELHLATTAMTRFRAHRMVRFVSPYLRLKEDQGLSGDQVALGAFVHTAAELLGQQLAAVILFGSRARGTPTPTSDYDCLLAVADELDPNTTMNMLLAARQAGSIDIHIETLSSLKRTIRVGHAARLNMILEGRAIYGYAASQLRTLARTAVKELGLSPAPGIGKGCWLARNAFPPDTPYHLYRKALKELASLGPEPISLRRAVVIDVFLQCLLATRIQGNLDCDRAYLLDLIRKYVLDTDDWRELKRTILNEEQPEAIGRFVGQLMRRKYGIDPLVKEETTEREAEHH